MFTKIELQNFRSFDHIVFDLQKNRNITKNLAIVYGENGSGKSNLMSAFVLLSELLDTMNVRDIYEELIKQASLSNNDNAQRRIQQQFVMEMRDIKAIIDDYKMIDSDDTVKVRYEFLVGGSTGEYFIELGEQEIVRERLEFRLNQRRGVYFDYNDNRTYINQAIIKDRDLLEDIKLTAKRYWGKHSILAIILHEMEDKAETYVNKNICENLEDLLFEFRFLSCNVGIGDRIWDELKAPIYMLQYPIEGSILAKKEKEINVAEQIFSLFFSSIDSEINEVKYRRDYHDKYINYKLNMVRLLSDSYRMIDFDRESKGNHQLLRLLCYLLTACFGGTVVLDEADSGIHDVLFKKIIQEIYGYITGQVILTTHNTMLMETTVSRNSIYFLEEEPGGHRSVKCISDFEKRTFLGNNIRNKYLNDEYSGLPKIERIDFEKLINQVENSLREQ